MAADHNAADATFAQAMIPHHTQAVDMSDMMLMKNDIPASVTALATKVKAAQGAKAARHFLTQLAAHHEGAIMMAKTGTTAGKNSDAIQLSKDIVSAQETEIQEMTKLLTTLKSAHSSRPLPHLWRDL